MPDRLTRCSGVYPVRRTSAERVSLGDPERFHVGSVIKKRRKRMAKKKHRKLLKKTRVQRRKLGK
ncbi:protein of unknown function [Pimelobacter simplex]|nr:hypothetical protein NSI01_05940 [Pimelobacter simplex]SFM97287.1 protein of unknown function [Pimelobacter simplex]